MASILKYRYPEGPVVEKYGDFIPFEGQKGFLVSDFEGRNKFVFVERNELGKLSFRKESPFVISKAEYIKTASLFLNQIIQNELGKAVFSRVKQVEFSSEKSDVFFHSLCDKYPNALVYFISDDQLGTWIGATPEILIEKTDTGAKTMALAGTLPIVGKDSWTQKEETEQRLVTDFICEILKKQGVENCQISERYERLAGPVKHLCNDISFDCTTDELTKIAFKLHPTPAVSGLPQKEAIELIKQLEQHNRLLYAGIVGEQHRLYVNLRCCELQKDTAFLYLGGGFTSQSDPEKEWQETENKSLTLINVINSLS